MSLCLIALAAPVAAPAAAQEPEPVPTPAPVAASNARIEAVQKHIDAYRSGDLDRFVATFATDAEVHANGIIAVGHKQIKAFYALNFKPDAPSVRLLDHGIDADVVWVSFNYVFPNGDEMCCSMSEYQVRDGKISFLRSTLQ